MKRHGGWPWYKVHRYSSAESVSLADETSCERSVYCCHKYSYCQNMTCCLLAALTGRFLLMAAFLLPIDPVTLTLQF